MDTAKKIFDTLEKTGETLTEQYHVLENTDPNNNEKSYRVYHSKGYCFDSFKYYDEDLDQIEYGFYSGWDDFKQIDKTEALALVKLLL